MALDELDELYRDSILSHVRNPRNHAVVPDADVTGESVNPFCGDETSLQLRLNDAGRVARVGLQGRGCSINRAAGSIMSEAIEDKSLDEIEALSALFRGMMRGREPAQDEWAQLGELEALSSVTQFPVRIKCALLAWATLEDGITEYRSKQDAGSS
jgi:nitrogen fixation NifU-like protein